jgi:hypothetical protein
MSKRFTIWFPIHNRHRRPSPSMPSAIIDSRFYQWFPLCGVLVHNHHCHPLILHALRTSQILPVDYMMWLTPTKSSTTAPSPSLFMPYTIKDTANCLPDVVSPSITNIATRPLCQWFT